MGDTLLPVLLLIALVIGIAIFFWKMGLSTGNTADLLPRPRRTLLPVAKVVGAAQSEAIERCFPVGPRSAQASEPTCAVCLQPIEEGEPCRTLQCNHIFHPDCITRALVHGWAQHSKWRCPVCRMDQLENSHHNLEPQDISQNVELNDVNVFSI